MEPSENVEVISSVDIAVSLVSERREFPDFPIVASLGPTPGPNVPLASWRSTTKRCRTMTVTLSPTERVDNKSPTINGVLPGFSAGGRSAVATGRTNPVKPPVFFVVMRWGVGGGKQCALLADWPELGTSFEVTGDHITVEAFMPAAAPDVLQAGRPVVQASIAPSEGVSRVGSVSPLSFCEGVLTTAAGAVGTNLAVPEFAREVIVLSRPPGGTLIEATFLDDAGNELLKWYSHITATPNDTMIAFMPVPGRATLLRIRDQAAAGGVDYFTMWRIAP